MKKVVRLWALIIASFMMFSFCSCNLKKSEIESSNAQSDELMSESYNKASDESLSESTNDNSFSSDVPGSVMQLMYDVIGKDQETAEKMIGEFFDVELNDSLGNIMTNERNGIVTTMHVYTDMFVKDSVRFNGLQIWTDEKAGHVRRVEFTLDNSGIISVPIEDTPEFQSEIKQLYEDVDGEFKKSLGQPGDSGRSIDDEDSFWAYYKISDNRFAYVEVIDYIEPGGNGLVSTSVCFADAEVLLD